MDLSSIEKSKIAIFGNVDAGKSSFIGVMKSGTLDNGNGSARLSVSKHQHEKSTGRTSSVSYHYIFDEKENGKEIITLVDLCGHEKYYNTTLYGATVSHPDFAIVMLAANNSVLGGMTKEHLRYVYTMNIPFIVLITKIDTTPEGVYNTTKDRLTDLFRQPNLNLKTVMIEKEQVNDDNLMYCKILNERGTKFIPIICISNKTGFNINFVRKFISNLKSPFYERIQTPFSINTDVFYLDSIWYIKGMGIAVSGFFRGNKLALKDTFYLGPNKNGNFIEVNIKSIHNACQESVPYLIDGYSGAVIITFDKKNEFGKKNFRKGMVLVRDLNSIKHLVTREFEADILIFHHHTTISDRYQAVIHCGGICATAFIYLPKGDETNKKKVVALRSGDKCTVKFKFIHSYLITIGDPFLFREGKMTGKGVIKKIIN